MTQAPTPGDGEGVVPRRMEGGTPDPASTVTGGRPQEAPSHTGAPTYTPGPWVYRAGLPYDWGWVTDARGDFIAQAKDPRANDGATLAAHRAARTDPWAANARLIAAAPELLGHLRFAVKLLSALPGFAGTAQVEAMAAAIAKAEGRDGLGRDPRPPVIDGDRSRDEKPNPEGGER